MPTYVELNGASMSSDAALRRFRGRLRVDAPHARAA